ncbi:MAG: GDSL-type esterase/lipase family protein [Candidatus Bathyarchaeia archaeon]|jgi:lysophospholipase L1-like esterase
MKKKMQLIAIVIAIMILATVIGRFHPLSLQTKEASDPIRVACVGDSITEITGYPSDLQTLLGDNYSVGNFGVSGSTVLLNSWEPYMNQSAFQKALNFQPNIVVIMLGTNDDLQMLRAYNASFEEDYAKLIASFQQLVSTPRIYIVKPPPIFSNSSDLSIPYFNEVIIPKIEDLANNMGLPIIDVYTAFGNHADYFVDGVHPNSQGAALIASEVYKAINPQTCSTT